ncbi:hypothetical protein H8959_018893, partial [Pygathrix nigripes]
LRLGLPAPLPPLRLRTQPAARRLPGPAPAAAPCRGPSPGPLRVGPGVRRGQGGRPGEARGTRARRLLCGLHGRQHLGAARATAGRLAAASPWGPEGAQPQGRRLRFGTSPPGCSSGRCAEAAKQLQPPPRRSTLAPCAMVTHSKFPAAGMSRPLDTSLRLKTFSSKSEYQLVVNAVRKLQESGFYWSAVTGGEANLLLSAEPAGTFLIRDSSDQRHFFTLSVKTQSGTKNLRIQCEGGSFSLQSDPRSTQPVPRFDCVLKLVHHYMPPPGAPSFPSPPTEPSSEVPEQPSAQPLPGSPPRRAYYIYSGGEKIPLVLSRPLSSNVADSSASLSEDRQRPPGLL